MDWRIEIDDVQQFWNVFENRLIKVIDEIVPLVEYHGNIIKEITPRPIKIRLTSA